MSLLKGKKILLAVTAGIAAYKAAFLVRLLIKKGAEVKVITTPETLNFVTPLTLSTLSKNSVEWEFFGEKGDWNNHVEFALWADLMLIAPCTANTLAKMAEGLCDNLVLATYLSSKSNVYFAPAMDLDMYQHFSTKENIAKLTSSGNILIPAETGSLASGLEGEGRMAEPENIVDFLEKDLAKNLPLIGKKVLITAGPTYEKLDPVRFIGNFSSGKMGFELADAAYQLGAETILICGPNHEKTPNPSIKRIDVISALEMKSEVDLLFDEVDIVIAAAAVADYRPKTIAENKIKKKEETLTLELVKNPDILKGLGERKNSQYLVGFALETNNEEENAKSKLEKKNLDLIILNSLQDEEAGFQKNTNKVTLLSKDGNVKAYQAKTKKEVAKDILDYILENYKK